MVKTAKRCCICGEPVHRYNAKYCLRCAKFFERLRTKHFPPGTVEAIREYLHQSGYFCYYTNLALDLENEKSPLYAVFDHWIPGDPRKVVVCCDFVNEMKSDMSEDEFWDTVFQLADYKRLGKPVKMKKFKYWERLYAPK